MKTTLTPEQSAELIAKGISADKASMCQLDFDYDGEIIDRSEVFEDCGKLLAVVNDEAIEVDRRIVSKDSDFDHSFADDMPIFTLADVCSLLPKEIVADTIICQNDICPIRINWDTNVQTWFVGYGLIPHPVGVGVDSELIDALFSILCWAIDNNHVKVKQPCQS